MITTKFDALYYLFTPQCETTMHTTCSTPFLDAAVCTMFFAFIVGLFSLLYAVIRSG